MINMNPETESPLGIDTTKARVEKILSELMGVAVHLNRNDPRIISVHEDIHEGHNGKKSRISDEEITKYVKKYYRFRAVVSEVETS